MPPASRLGPYELVSAIGAGGMGEVFRARDTKLGRDVAIKVLPAAFAQDPERLARFEREARVLASLNHTNIAHVYGFESATLPDGSVAHFLAMEMVEGEDLAERLRRGAIPIDEAIAIAKQIAEGLEEAHEHAIIHRDLKPANVKVTPDGKVKVLDFGLAKAYSNDGSSGGGAPDTSNSPTVSRHLTETGTVMGTAAYMSPEQARGKAVDKRADIWSFGVVLFEMLSATRLFKGATVSDTLAAVLRDDLPWSNLPAQTPRGVIQLLGRCLARDPRQRLRDIGEARMALSDPLESAERPASGPLTTMPARRPIHPAALTLMVISAAALGAWAWTRLQPAVPKAVTRLWSLSDRGAAPVTRPAYEFSVLQPTGSANAPGSRRTADIWPTGPRTGSGYDRSTVPTRGHSTEQRAGRVPSGRLTAASSDSSLASGSSGSISPEAFRRMSRRCRRAGRWPPGQPRAAS